MVTNFPGSGPVKLGTGEDVFSAYVKRVRPGLRRSMFLLCGDWHMADDLVQQTLMIMYTHWDAINDARARNSYARTVMVRLLAREQRSSYAQREQVESLVPESAEPDGTDGLAERSRVEGALEALSYQQREAVVLRFWLGLSTEEIAQVLSCPTGTVRSHLSRAFAKLRMELRRTEGSGQPSPPAMVVRASIRLPRSPRVSQR